MGETQIDLNNQSSTTASATGGHQEEFQAFISTGRTGRRNAIQGPDILVGDNRDADNTINVVHLAQQLQSLKTPSSINDGQVPSTSKSADLTETLTQPTTTNMKVAR